MGTSQFDIKSVDNFYYNGSSIDTEVTVSKEIFDLIKIKQTTLLDKIRDIAPEEYNITEAYEYCEIVFSIFEDVIENFTQLDGERIVRNLEDEPLKKSLLNPFHRFCEQNWFYQVVLTFLRNSLLSFATEYHSKLNIETKELALDLFEKSLFSYSGDDLHIKLNDLSRNIEKGIDSDFISGVTKFLSSVENDIKESHDIFKSIGSSNLKYEAEINLEKINIIENLFLNFIESSIFLNDYYLRSVYAITSTNYRDYDEPEIRAASLKTISKGNYDRNLIKLDDLLTDYQYCQSVYLVNDDQKIINLSPFYLDSNISYREAIKQDIFHLDKFSAKTKAIKFLRVSENNILFKNVNALNLNLRDMGKNSSLNEKNKKILKYKRPLFQIKNFRDLMSK